MAEKTGGDEIVSKAMGVAVALGALAVGVATALLNNERSKQVREDMRRQVDELGKRVDDLSAQVHRQVETLSTQAGRVVEQRRPEIESTIQRGREAVVEGLDRAKTVVEQSADKAQEYVQRAASQAGGNGVADKPASDISPDAAHEVQERQNAESSPVDWAGDAGYKLDEVMSEAGDLGDVPTSTGAAMPDAMSDLGGTENRGMQAASDTLDDMRHDNLTTSSLKEAVGAEDMSSANDFTERNAEQIGYQMEGYMHSHQATEDGERSDTEAGNSSEGRHKPDAEAPTLDIHHGEAEADSDVNNEPPRPGDTATTDNLQ